MLNGLVYKLPPATEECHEYGGKIKFIKQMPIIHAD
jgi:hypothetical protein